MFSRDGNCKGAEQLRQMRESTENEHIIFDAGSV